MVPGRQHSLTTAVRSPCATRLSTYSGSSAFSGFRQPSMAPIHMVHGNEGGERPTTGLLSLPVELRECIFELCLVSVQPATYSIVKDPQRLHWTLITKGSRHTPALLLVCRTITPEVEEVMSLRIASNPVDSIPLSRGPTIRIEPRWAVPASTMWTEWRT